MARKFFCYRRWESRYTSSSYEGPIGHLFGLRRLSMFFVALLKPRVNYVRGVKQEPAATPIGSKCVQDREQSG